MKRIMTGALLLLALGSALGEHVAHEDFLNAPDRIEWPAGGLYDGRFEDGTRFQIQLAYARPAALGDEVPLVAESYWYPKHVSGYAYQLRDVERSAGTLRLALQPNLNLPAEESFTVVLAPDKLSGRGTWTSATPHKQMAFTLQRAIVYDYVVVKRPAPPEASKDDPGRGFVFAAYFPLLGDADADAWVREQAGNCDGDLECLNDVQVRWKSRSLVSLDASSWNYNYMAPHGNGDSTTRQYRLDQGRLAPVGLDAFVDLNPACADRIKSAIVRQLHARQLAWADQWDKNAAMDNKWVKFTPTASGIAFRFDPYEVGPYSQGAPSVFVTRAQIGTCLRYLPQND
jgi:hypothetical protein